MKHKHILFLVLAIAVVVIITTLVPFDGTEAGPSIITHPVGGLRLKTPALKMTIHEKECTTLVSCAGKGPGVPVSGVWSSILDNTGETFSLNPDLSPKPAPNEIYYIPTALESKTKTTLTSGQCLLGLYAGPTVEPVGICTCTYEYPCPPAVCTQVTPVTIQDKVATIFEIWGTNLLKVICPFGI